MQPIAEVAQAAPQSKLPWVAAIALTATIASAAVWNLKPDPPTEPRAVSRFDYLLPQGQVFTNPGRPLIGLSPDGERLAYVTADGLYLRSMDQLNAQLISGTTNNLTSPVFSPNGQWVVYWARGDVQLKKIAISGGAPVPLCDATNPFGVSWGADDNLLFGQPDGIWRVPANGGTPELIVEAGEGEAFHGPQLLPGETWVLFTVTTAQGESRWDEAEIVIQSLESGERRVLWRGGSDARYLQTGHLVYALEDVLFAIPFDIDNLEVTGGPVSMVQEVRRAAGAAATTASAQYDFSDNGTFVHIPGGVRGDDSNLAFLDRQGSVEVLPALTRSYIYPRFSPDDTRIVVQINDDDGSNIWIYEIENNIPNQLTFDGGERPLWSPDGTEVTFLNGNGLWTVPSNFSGTPTMLPGTEPAGNRGPGSWSPDGAVLLFGSSEGIHAWRRETRQKTHPKRQR